CHFLYLCVYTVCVRVCVCVCVRLACVRACVCVCVSVCLCEREVCLAFNEACSAASAAGVSIPPLTTIPAAPQSNMVRVKERIKRTSLGLMGKTGGGGGGGERHV